MPHAIKLTQNNLAPLPCGDIARPTYDRAALRRGSVHLGMGGFHRAHMARYTHDLLEKRPDALEWGIAVVGLMPGDVRLGEALAPQDHLYTLVERDTETAKVIGSVAETIFAPAQGACGAATIGDNRSWCAIP